MWYSVKYKGCIELNRSANGMTQSDRESLVNEGNGSKKNLTREHQSERTISPL